MNDPNSAPLIAYILAKLFVLYLMYLLVKKVLKIVGINLDKPKYPEYYPRESLLNNSIQSMFKFLFTAPFKFIGFLFGLDFGDNPKNAFMRGFEKNNFFKSSNKGLLVDGESLRLSESVSYQHMAVIGTTGSGKSTKIVIPNIFTLKKSSIVVTDLSGELFNKTSGYMKKKGYDIQVLNLADIDHSLRYNPLYYIDDSNSIKKLAKLLVSSYNTSSSGDDVFWNSGAEQIIYILISCLINTRQAEYINLANVRFLLNQLIANSDDVNSFVARYAENTVWNDYQGFINTSDNTLRSMIATALNSLNAISDNNLALLTSENSIDFKSIREKKTIFYLIVPQEDIKYYSFLINIFYSQLFSSIMKDGNKNKLPVYFLLDEFGHLKIPNFSTIITTIRKYNVSISIFLQSVNQLNMNYGNHEASAILDGGIGSKLFLKGGINNENLLQIERMLGTYRKKYKEDGKIVFRDEKIMTAEQIRTMPDNQSFYLYINKKPAILNMKSYYENSRFKRYSKKTPVNFVNTGSRSVEYIRL